MTRKRYILQNRYQDEGWTTTEQFDSESDALDRARECSYDSIACGMARILDMDSGLVMIEYPAGSNGKPSLCQDAFVLPAATPESLQATARYLQNMFAAKKVKPTTWHSDKTFDQRYAKRMPFQPVHIQTFMGGKFEFDRGETTLGAFKAWLADVQSELAGWGDDTQKLTVWMQENVVDATLRDGIVQ